MTRAETTKAKTTPQFFVTFYFVNAVKLYNNDHPRDLKILAVVDRWSLFKGRLCFKNSKRDLKKVVVVHRWSLFRSGRTQV